MRSLVRDPSSGGGLLATWFGKLPVDRKNSEDPWTRQLLEDLRICKVVPHWEIVFDTIINNHMLLFQDFEVKRDFLDFSVKELRAVLLDQLERVFTKNPNSRKDMPSCLFKCDIRISESRTCGYEADTREALYIIRLFPGFQDMASGL